MPKTYEPVTTKTGMTRVKEERMPFGWSVNPYRGCAHGCSFCFARGFQGFLDRKADDEFQNHILFKENAPEALEEQLSRMARRFRHDLGQMRDEVGEVMIGTVTDPYQPLESKMQLTRKCLAVLGKYGIRVSLTTRSPLLLRDLDLLERMPSLSVNISLNTMDDSLARRLEPGSPLPSQRVRLLRRLTERGIRTGIFIAPVLPFLTDNPEDLEALFAAAVEGGASGVMTSLLRLSPDVKGWYFRTLQEEYPDKLAAYRRLYAGGGYAEEGYREGMSRILGELHRKYTPRLRQEPAGVKPLLPEAFGNGDDRKVMKNGERVNEGDRFAMGATTGEPPVEQLSFSF